MKPLDNYAAHTACMCRDCQRFLWQDFTFAVANLEASVSTFKTNRFPAEVTLRRLGLASLYIPEKLRKDTKTLYVVHMLTAWPV